MPKVASMTQENLRGYSSEETLTELEWLLQYPSNTITELQPQRGAMFVAPGFNPGYIKKKR
jgi:hypothetical protein